MKVVVTKVVQNDLVHVLGIFDACTQAIDALLKDISVNEGDCIDWPNDNTTQSDLRNQFILALIDGDPVRLDIKQSDSWYCVSPFE